MSNLTGKGLAEYAIDRIGTPYFFGAKIHEGALTENKMAVMHRMYPGTVTDAYIKKARNKGQVGKVNTDCSGLIAGYRGKNVGSSQLYQQAYSRLPIAEIRNFAVGTVLWKSGHVGVYIGLENDEPMCVEARGIHYGTIKSKARAVAWKYGLTFADLTYAYDVHLDGGWKGENPYQDSGRVLKVGRHGEDVMWLQWELVEAGYFIEVDGKFGPATKKALGSFQRSCKIKRDYKCGPVTRRYLRAD